MPKFPVIHRAVSLTRAIFHPLGVRSKRLVTGRSPRGCWSVRSGPTPGARAHAADRVGGDRTHHFPSLGRSGWWTLLGSAPINRAPDGQNGNSLVNGLLLGLLTMLPMLGLTLFWRTHPRSRSRGMAEAFGAILVAVLIGFYVGPSILEGAGGGVGLTVPMVLGGMVMGMSLNRMARNEQ